MTAIAAALALSLSGCTFGLGMPAPKPETAPSLSPQSSSEEEPTESSSGLVDEPVYTDAMNCADGESFELTNDNYDGGYLAVTGNCADILVSANNITLNFESVERLAITGLYNTISVSGTLGQISIPGDANNISGVGVGDLLVDGYSNVVTFETASSVAVNGDENSVAWYGGASSGSDSGVGNFLSAP